MSQSQGRAGGGVAPSGVYRGEAGAGLAGAADFMSIYGMMGGGRGAREREPDFLDPPTHWTDEEDTDVEDADEEEVGNGAGDGDSLPKRPPASHSESSSARLVSSVSVDCVRDRYPFCIVWSPLPMITWLCPIIGHMGICDSRGFIWDFQGPYSIGRDDMAFGRPTRYIQLDPRLARKFLKAAGGGGDAIASDEEIQASWDESVYHSNCHYSKRMHNICCQNCHHHAARAMNKMAYRGVTSWNQFYLAFWVFFCGRFRSVSAAVYTFAPFCVILSIFLLIRYGGS